MIYTHCTVCKVKVGKGNTTGRCLSHSRNTLIVSPDCTVCGVRLNHQNRTGRCRLHNDYALARSTDWCPAELRGEYRKMCKLMPGAEAKRIILDDLAAKERARIAALSPFERQMDAVRRGVGLVQKFEPVRSYDRTLGGVS